MSRILTARGTVAGRPYVLAVGLYGLGVRLVSTASLGRQRALIVHQPIRSLVEAEGAVAVTYALLG